MYQTPEDCRAAWEAAGGHGNIDERIRRNAAWIEYYKYIAEKQASRAADFDPHAEEVVQFLSDNGWIRKNDSVLDIGSGMGTYALSFAKKGCKVTALDMDTTSLSILKADSVQLGLTGIYFENNMWEAYQANEQFSVSFSSLCPAICTYDELLKMESMTTKSCCLLAVTRGSYDLHRKNLMQMLSVTPKGGMTTEALWYYEMLYLMGRQPDVKNWSRHYEYDLPIEEVCSRNEVYFQIFGITAEESRPILRRYFEEQAVNGLVHDETQLNTALICWHPNGGNRDDA